MSGAAEAQRLILRGGGSAGLGFAVRLGARILFLLLAARLYGAVLFGAYSLALAVVELAVTIAGLGTKRILFPLLDEDASGRTPIHVVFDAALAVLGVGLALAGATMLAIPLAFGDWARSETATALFLVAPMIAGQALLDLFLAATRWKHVMRHEVVGRSIVEPYAAIAGAFGGWWLGFGATGLVIGYWAGTLAALGYAGFGMRRCFGSFELARYRPSLGEVCAVVRAGRVPTLNDFVSGLFTRIDLYLVGAMLGEAPAGIYGMARQIRTPIRQVRQSFDGMLAPLVARTLAATSTAETGRATASAARLILAIQLPVLVGLAVIGLPLMRWLGPEFAAGYWALVILAAAETIQGAFGVSDLIFVYRRPAVALRITLVSCAVNLIAGWLLIRWLGLDGAALAVLLALSSGALVRRHALQSSFGVGVPLSYSAGPLAAAALATGAAGLAVHLLAPGPDLLVFGPALAAALATYAAVLRLWLWAARDSLRLVSFRTE